MLPMKNDRAIKLRNRNNSFYFLPPKFTVYSNIQSMFLVKEKTTSKLKPFFVKVFIFMQCPFIPHVGHSIGQNDNKRQTRWEFAL